ncbi:MAG TPA: COX15/CtaA family protein [Anaeromyxobacteraceae bacterium]|nr:COX15/CtaA family protein [Anaeromyxobacteraceae bacterium]
MRAFARFAWCVLAYNVVVIAWGAFVRATGSGAGCGRHWPTCQGAVVPRAPAVETVIEYAHRATSGLSLVLVVALFAWALRAFPRGHAARRAASWSLALVVTEALLGAGLVLFGWVARDASAGRGWAMALHLVNTFLLLAALAFTAAWGTGPAGLARRAPPAVVTGLALGAVTMVFSGVTGAVAALGDTLFPATSLVHGFLQDLDGNGALLLRLRVFHPVAAAVAAAVLISAARLAARERPERRVRRAAAAVAALVAVQLVAGAVNLALLAPVWLQLVHLALADLTWIALVLLASASLAPGAEGARAEAPLAEPAAQRG